MIGASHLPEDLEDIWDTLGVDSVYTPPAHLDLDPVPVRIIVDGGSQETGLEAQATDERVVAQWRRSEIDKIHPGGTFTGEHEGEPFTLRVDAIESLETQWGSAVVDRG